MQVFIADELVKAIGWLDAVKNWLFKNLLTKFNVDTCSINTKREFNYLGSKGVNGYIITFTHITYNRNAEGATA
jgi:hypothetical protein